MKCHECQEMLSPYLDNMTNDEENRQITVHLAECRSCSNDLQQMKLMLEGLGFDKGEVPLPDGYKEELHVKLLSHKTSLWGRRHQALPIPRTGGWIAASVAALALTTGIWISSAVPYAQVAETLQKAAPSIFDRGNLQVRPAIEKLIAEKTQEILTQKNSQPGKQDVNPSNPQQVAENDPSTSQNPVGKPTSPNTNTQQPTVNTPVNPGSPKIAAVVAMQVTVENLDTALHLLKAEAESQNTMVAANDSDIYPMGAGRERVVDIQVPEEQVKKWTDLLGELGDASVPSERSEDVTKTYNSLNDQIAGLQQQLADPGTKNTEQLQTQLQEKQKQLQAIKDRLQMVTIRIKLHEDIAP